MKLIYLVISAYLFNLPVSGQIPGRLSSYGVDTTGHAFELLAQQEGKANHILLKWKYAGRPTGFFSVERRLPEKEFEVIGVLKAVANQAIFEFTDEKPAKTRNSYRIKMVSPEKTIYSPVVTAGTTAKAVCSFYPNPVDKVLIVRSEFHVHLLITDSFSRLRFGTQLAPGLHLVDLSMLEKGIYIIHFLQKETNRIVTEKLIKQ